MTSTSSIADCLYEKTVLEFPTFYVLPYPPDDLPAGFITEAQYLGSESREKDSQEGDIEELSTSESESESDTDTDTDTDSTGEEDDDSGDVEKI